MRIPRIYSARLLEAGIDVELETGPSQHIARVLRMPVGAELILFDGRGGEYPAAISAIGKKHVTATTGEHCPTELESPLAIHLGIAVSRGERMDWVVQKATELGVAVITPLFSERTEVRLSGERARRKLCHWQQVAISACEQCGRNTLPRIEPLARLEDWLGTAEADCRLVLHHRADGAAPESDKPPARVALLTGPEGGLSAQEITAAERSGYRALRLGPRVLRTETAPLAAIAILQARWGDLGS